MSDITLGIIGGGQLGSMLAIAAKKLGIKIIIFCDDLEAPAQNFCDEFIGAKYDDKEKINEFVNKVDICLLYTSPSPRDGLLSRMPSSA